MLQEELRDSDIPHHTSLHEWILEVWNDHLDKLQERWQCVVMFIELIVLLICQKNSLRRISSMMAHWMEVTTVQTSYGPQHLINLHSDLIRFYHVTGHHNGERLTTALMEILDSIGITPKVITLSA